MNYLFENDFCQKMKKHIASKNDWQWREKDKEVLRFQENLINRRWIEIQEKAKNDPDSKVLESLKKHTGTDDIGRILNADLTEFFDLHYLEKNVVILSQNSNIRERAGLAYWKHNIDGYGWRTSASGLKDEVLNKGSDCFRFYKCHTLLIEDLHDCKYSTYFKKRLNGLIKKRLVEGKKTILTSDANLKKINGEDGFQLFDFEVSKLMHTHENRYYAFRCDKYDIKKVDEKFED